MPVPDSEYGSGSTDLIESGSNTDLDPQHCLTSTGIVDRLDSCSRNVYRYEDLKDSVVLEKIKDHYIFTVESVGAIKPHELVSSLDLN